jgi:hypothetical protein
VADFVRARLGGGVASGRELRRSHPQRCEAGDLAVEQPTKIYVTINLKTAKALGLKIRQLLHEQAESIN